jgi:transposase
VKQYVGLDVSLKEVCACVVDADGRVMCRETLPCEPDAIADFMARRAPNAERVVHESGMLSTWLTRELEARDVPIICIDARMAHKALSAHANKSDRADAEGLAQLARTGWFARVHIRGEGADRMRALVGARERLLRMRKDLEAHVRGVLKTFGIRMGVVTRGRQRQSFRDQLQAAAANDPVLQMIAETLVPIHERLCAAADALEETLMLIARKSPLAKRLMTVPEVGQVTARSASWRRSMTPVGSGDRPMSVRSWG